jgi:16S rRNA processing protein RimM
MDISEAFYIGYITKTKGLKGEVQVFFEYPQPGDLNLDTLFIEQDKKLVPYFTASYKLHTNQTGYFTFDDLDTIEKAQKIVRKKIYLPLSQKPERDPAEFLITDLKGFIVHDHTHGELGEIIEIHEYPQQYVAVVPHKFREIMFPLNEELIKEIDQEKGLLYVDLPEGLIDVYLNQ